MALNYANLQKLSLPIKQGFKFLDSLGFCSENKVMFFTRQTYKVGRSVIFRNTIKMMHVPSFGKFFTHALFPNKHMMANIALFICPIIIGHKFIKIVYLNHNIDTMFNSCLVFSVLKVATTTSFRASCDNLSTILASVNPIGVISFPKAPFSLISSLLRGNTFFGAVKSMLREQSMLPQAIRAQRFINCVPYKIFSAILAYQLIDHTYSLPQLNSISQGQRGVM